MTVFDVNERRRRTSRSLTSPANHETIRATIKLRIVTYEQCSQQPTILSSVVAFLCVDLRLMRRWCDASRFGAIICFITTYILLTLTYLRPVSRIISDEIKCYLLQLLLLLLLLLPPPLAEEDLPSNEPHAHGVLFPSPSI